MKEALFVMAFVMAYLFVGMVALRALSALWEMSAEDIAPIAAIWPAALTLIAAYYTIRTMWRLVDRPFTALEQSRARRIAAEREVSRWLESK